MSSSGASTTGRPQGGSTKTPGPRGPERDLDLTARYLCRVSGVWRILGVVSAMPEPPTWVVPALDEIEECYRLGFRLLDRGLADARDRGVQGALVWLTIGEVPPMTARPASMTTWKVARSESWVALCMAAGMPPPTASDWQRLDVAPLPALTADREFAYGAWRALAWLLGVRQDWPMHTGRHRAGGIAPERPHLHGPQSATASPAWQAAEQAARDQAEADALAHWRHIRGLADQSA